MAAKQNNPEQKDIKELLIDYTVHLADNALILGHRNSEWTGHGPVLEQDIAISNIALDLIGQSRNLFQYAAVLIGNGKTEDDLAYHRDIWEFKNCLLVEQPKGDWAQTIIRQFLFSSYQYFFYSLLQRSNDQTLAAIAVKSLKEVTYHLRWSSEWVIRLGDGTAESNKRINAALEMNWRYIGELMMPATYEHLLSGEGIAVDLLSIRHTFDQKISEIFSEATLSVPSDTTMIYGGKNGQHSEHLGYILAEMQFLQRAYPGCQW